jgi:hypothetical protein
MRKLSPIAFLLTRKMRCVATKYSTNIVRLSRQAISLCDATDMALAHYGFPENIGRASGVFEQLEFRAVAVNTANAIPAQSPSEELKKVVSARRAEYHTAPRSSASCRLLR